VGVTRALQRRRIIERPRLIALLDESTARVRTLIAPAGYGKTTLAEQWVDKEGRRGAWFTARPSSTDVAALALGMARAATEIVPDCDVRLREHLRALPAPAERVDVLAELLGEDFANWPQDAWFVLDDYQELEASADAEKFVEELVAASALQLLIASRQRPSWITARRILYGEILELNQTELAMDGHEAAEVMSERNAASASGLVAVANGWPAVIGLASVSAAEVGERSPVPESLYQFFAEEVFGALESDVQAGLVTLAIAPVCDRSLAARLLGETVDRVCATATDVGILVGRDGRLEIHPLARAFLEGQHEHAGSIPASEAVNHCVAYYCEWGEWDAAFDLVARCGQAGDIESVLEGALDSLLETARLATLEQWCNRLDQANLESGILSLSRAEVAIRRGHLAAAQAHAESVVRVAPHLEFRAFSIAGRAAHLESREDEALAFFRRAEASAPTEALRRSALWDQVLCMIDLEMPEAIEAIEQLVGGVNQHDSREIVRAASCRSMWQARFGDLDPTQADRAFQLLSLVRDPILETGFLSSYSAVLVLVARYADARHVADLLHTAAQRYRLDFAVPWALSAMGNALAGLREWSDAEVSFYRGIEEARRASNAHAEQECISSLVRALCQQGHHEAALAISPIVATSTDLTAPLRATRAGLLAARALVLSAIDRTDEASKTVDSIRHYSRTSENVVLVAGVDAVVALKRHDRDAVERVEALADVAFSTGAVDLMVVAYRSVPELLPALLRTGQSDAVAELVRRVGDDDLAKALGHVLSPSAKAETLLTGRQRQVYELLRQGMTNREIAQFLVITEGTAKLHVHHIFDRLGVRSRKAIALQAALERQAQATSAIDETADGTDSES
jgi:LuxR family transcriptional regulator, maltose regulon positive regulatory protein